MTHCLRAVVDERLINCLFHPVLRPRHDDVTPLPSRLSRSSGSGAVPRPCSTGLWHGRAAHVATALGRGSSSCRDRSAAEGQPEVRQSRRPAAGPGKPHRAGGFPGTEQEKHEVNGYAALFAKRSRVAESPVRFSCTIMVFNTR